MTEQIVRTGCSTCEFADGNGYNTANCPGAAQEGNPGGMNYQPAITPEITRYEYTWNAENQLSGAKKYVDGSERVTMSYRYDAGGGRVIREKSEVVSDPSNIYQDLYISGGYERRQVQLQDLSGAPVSINTSTPGPIAFEDVDGTRLVK